MNQNIATIHPVSLFEIDLQEYFELCKKWNDADQWDILGTAYCLRGYELNALYCFRLADALRDPAVVMV